MFDNNPFSGFINAWASASAAALQWSSDRLADLADFVGLAALPPTVPLVEEFTPPFSGGQCTFNYVLQIGVRYQTGGILGYYISQNGSGTPFTQAQARASGTQFAGKITSIDFRPQTVGSLTWRLYVNGVATNIAAGNAGGNLVTGYDLIFLIPANAANTDSCGNLPNPNPPYPESSNAFESGNPDDGTTGELVAAGLPVLTVGGILAALKTIADAIGVVADVLEGVRKIGEAVRKIADLLDEIFNGKKEDDRVKPKYRRYAVGDWYRLPSIDGFIPTTPITLGGVEAIPYKVQVVVENFPATSSRVLGVLSPSISIDTLPLFYLLLQEDDFGITAVKPIRTLNSSTSIPPFHRGIFWNFRLNPSINAKYRLFYQTEQIEEEVEIAE